MVPTPPVGVIFSVRLTPSTEGAEPCFFLGPTQDDARSLQNVVRVGGPLRNSTKYALLDGRRPRGTRGANHKGYLQPGRSLGVPRKS